MKKPLNALEIEEYYKYLFEDEHRRLLVEACPNKKGGSQSMRRSRFDTKGWAGVPNQVQIRESIVQYHSVLKNYTKCMPAQVNISTYLLKFIEPMLCEEDLPEQLVFQDQG